MLLEALAVVPHVPNNQLQSPPTVTDQKSAPRWWTWRHGIMCAVLGVDFAYITIVIGWLGGSGKDRVMSPQLSQIFVVALGVCTILSVSAVNGARRRSQANDQFTITHARLSAIESRLPKHREWTSGELPTVPNLARGGLYTASVAVAAAQRPTVSADAIAEQIEDRVVERAVRRVQGRIDEAREQGHWSGYSACARDGLAGVGAAEVKRLPGTRNGGPSPS